jgi:hypothetical protein
MSNEPIYNVQGNNQINNPTPEADRSGLAIASMVLGIVGVVLFCIWYISLPSAILALIFGSISRQSKNRGMAITGIVLGIVCLGLTLLAFTLLAGLIATIGSSL